MASMSRCDVLDIDRDHVGNEGDFAESVPVSIEMAGIAPDSPEANHDVEAIISDEVQTRVGKHTGVAIVVNFSLLVLVAAWVGIYIQRISDLTAKVDRMQSVEVLSVKIDALTQEVSRLRTELDRMNMRRNDDGNGR